MRHFPNEIAKLLAMKNEILNAIKRLTLNQLQLLFLGWCLHCESQFTFPKLASNTVTSLIFSITLMMESGRSDDSILNEIFDFNHLLSNNLNNHEETVFSLIDLYGKFSVSSQKNDSLAHVNTVGTKFLDLLCSILTNTNEEFVVKWFPDYGCVLLAVTVDMNCSESSLELIGLDSW
jgi:hypothetical protein